MRRRSRQAARHLAILHQPLFGPGPVPDPDLLNESGSIGVGAGETAGAASRSVNTVDGGTSIGEAPCPASAYLEERATMQNIPSHRIRACATEAARGRQDPDVNIRWR